MAPFLICLSDSCFSLVSFLNNFEVYFFYVHIMSLENQFIIYVSWYWDYRTRGEAHYMFGAKRDPAALKSMIIFVIIIPLVIRSAEKNSLAFSPNLKNTVSA